jgi:chemotaxis response regulator CheB
LLEGVVVGLPVDGLVIMEDLFMRSFDRTGVSADFTQSSLADRPWMSMFLLFIPPEVARRVAVVLPTCMGTDGADGLVSLRQAGVLTMYCRSD